MTRLLPALSGVALLAIGVGVHFRLWGLVVPGALLWVEGVIASLSLIGRSNGGPPQ